MQVFGTGANNAVYSASKSAVLALTNASAEEYKNFGISVYAMAPSTIDTDNNRRSMPKADTSKWVKIQEIVDAALFLCGTGDSSNGTILKFPGKL
jgi:NAD(P)-dependent dehydrogenase (short-subunit alcohol dehydrogenase family)